MLCVYVLREPDSGDVRYVGITEHERTRARQYERCGGHQICSPVGMWLADLSRADKRPVFEAVLRVSPSDIDVPPHIIGFRQIPMRHMRWMLERMFVEHYLRSGCDLLNAQHVKAPRRVQQLTT